MKLKILGPALAISLLVGGISVGATTKPNNGLPDQLSELQAIVAELAIDVKEMLPLKDDVKSTKEQLAIANDTINNQQKEIDLLKKQVEEIKASSPIPGDTLTKELKDSILEEVKRNINDFTNSWEDDMSVNINVVNYDIKEVEGKQVLQIFTEGDYDWTDRGMKWSAGAGRNFARNFIFNFDPIVKQYGVNLHYEFYQNGEKIQSFIK